MIKGPISTNGRWHNRVVRKSMFYRSDKFCSFCKNVIDTKVNRVHLRKEVIRMEQEVIEEMEALYARLMCLKASGNVVDVWGDDDGAGNEGVLGDIFEFLFDNFGKDQIDWVDAYIQIYSWEYETFHEGSITYYSNFYGDSDYATIIKTANYIKSCGLSEIYKVYISAAHDYSAYEDWRQYPKTWCEQAKQVQKWIYQNEDQIFHCMMMILVDNMKEMCTIMNNMK